jgi:hypothetical protein
MTVVIESGWPLMGVNLAGFRTGIDTLETEHREWLKLTLIFIASQEVDLDVILVGGASRAGNAFDNLHLSAARVNSVINFLDNYPAYNRIHAANDSAHRYYSGEGAAVGSRDSDPARCRVVGVWAKPIGLFWPDIPERFRDNSQRVRIEREIQSGKGLIVSAFQTVSDHRFPQRGLVLPTTGDSLAAMWSPVQTKMLGFGLTIKNLLQGNVSHEIRQPGGYFLNVVTLEAAGSAADIEAHTSQSSRAQGARLAIQTWNQLSPNVRWALRDGPSEHDLRKTLCLHFKNAFQRCFSYLERMGTSASRGTPSTRMYWYPGNSEFYTVQEEIRDPPS